MKPSLAAACLGTSLLLSVQSAQAGVVSWDNPETRELSLTWSSDAAASLAAYLAVEKRTVAEDEKARRGPGGGILLEQFRLTSVEVDPASGLVYAVTVTKDGKLRSKRPLLDLFAGAPNLFEKNDADKKKSYHVVVTASVARTASTARVLDKAARASRALLTFDIVVYSAKGADAQVLDQTSLAFDADTLEPAIAPKAVRRYVDIATGGPLLYWGAVAGGPYYWAPSYEASVELRPEAG